MELGDSAFMETQGKNKDQARQKGKGKVPPQANIKKESKCFLIHDQVQMIQGRVYLNKTQKLANTPNVKTRRRTKDSCCSSRPKASKTHIQRSKFREEV